MTVYTLLVHTKLHHVGVDTHVFSVHASRHSAIVHLNEQIASVFPQKKKDFDAATAGFSEDDWNLHVENGGDRQFGFDPSSTDMQFHESSASTHVFAVIKMEHRLTLRTDCEQIPAMAEVVHTR